MQITRQRVRPEMKMTTMEKCPCCNGTGEITSTILLDDEIEDTLKNILTQNNNIKKKLVLKVSPIVAAYLTKGIFSIRLKWMLKYKVWIKIFADSEYGFIRYDFCDTDGKPLNNY